MPLKLFSDTTIKAKQVFVILIYSILCVFCVKYIPRKMTNYAVKDYSFSSAVIFTFNSPVWYVKMMHDFKTTFIPWYSPRICYIY